jgi:hypothetical protein
MEHKVILFLLFTLLLAACEKPNPEPEKLDPIYSAIEKEIKEAESAISSTETMLKEAQDTFDKAVPQTGQIKFARKRLYEAKAQLEKQKQMKRYLELRLKSRLDWDRSQYLKAYNKKEVWPKPEEWDQYQAQKALEGASKQWSNRRRMEEAALPAPKPSGGHNSEEAAEAPPEHH